MRADALDRYRRVLATPGIRPVVVGAALFFLTSSGATLAIVLAVRGSSGSFAQAGAVAAAFAIGASVVAPVRGRLLDRYGQLRVCRAFGVAHAVGLAGLCGLTSVDVPLGTLIAAAAVTGAAFPPAFAAMNALWGFHFADTDLLDAAYAVEGGIEETALVSGPLVTGAIVTVASPAAALGVFAVLVAAATWVFARADALLPAKAPSTASGRRIGAPLRSPAVRLLLCLSLLLGGMVGVLEIALPHFAAEHGNVAQAALLLACFSLGTALGGLVFGVLASAANRRRDFVASGLASACVLAAAPIADSMVALAAFAAALGLAFGPANVRLFGFINLLAPAGNESETFTWVASAQLAGIALGSAAAGGLVDGSGGTDVALLVAAGACCLGAIAGLGLTTPARPYAAASPPAASPSA